MPESDEPGVGDPCPQCRAELTDDGGTSLVYCPDCGWPPKDDDEAFAW